MTNSQEDFDKLSPDNLQQTIAHILRHGSNFHALTGAVGTSSQFTKGSPRSSITPDGASGTSAIRLLCCRLHFIGYLKYNLWRIGQNVEHGNIEICSKSDDSSTSKSQRDAFNNRIPFVPLGSEGTPPSVDGIINISHLHTSLIGACWISDSSKKPSPPPDNSECTTLPEPSASRRSSRHKGEAPGNASTYSVSGFVKFLTSLQKLYISFMDVRIRFRESQDQNAIMKAAMFLAELDEFDKKSRISDLYELMRQNKDGASKEQYWDYDRYDMAIVSFLNLPDWICPR